eukprot:scaffold121447_cov23-Tisochrysis_lutea.AAC.2
MSSAATGPVNFALSSHANAAKYFAIRAAPSRAIAGCVALLSEMRVVTTVCDTSRICRIADPHSARASARRKYELFVRNTRRSPIAVTMSDIGTGEVRGSSVAGRLAMQ